MRARLAGEVQQRQLLLAEAQEALDDCDRTILRLHPNGDPGRIPAIQYQPVRLHIGRRGALRGTVMDVLREHSPNPLTTPKLAALVQERLKIRFTSNKERISWVHSVNSALRVGVNRGQAERTQRGTFGAPPQIPTMWRWKSGVKSLEMLAAEMDAAGFAYEYVKAEPEDATA